MTTIKHNGSTPTQLEVRQEADSSNGVNCVSTTTIMFGEEVTAHQSWEVSSLTSPGSGDAYTCSHNHGTVEGDEAAFQMPAHLVELSQMIGHEAARVELKI